MSLFLSSEEVAELTGYRQPSRQMEWLSSHGWIFEVTAHGEPRVSRGHFERMMGDRVERPKEPKLRLSS